MDDVFFQGLIRWFASYMDGERDLCKFKRGGSSAFEARLIMVNGWGDM